MSSSVGESQLVLTEIFHLSKNLSFMSEAGATRDFSGQTFEHPKIQTFEQKQVSAMSPCQS